MKTKKGGNIPFLVDILRLLMKKFSEIKKTYKKKKEAKKRMEGMMDEILDEAEQTRNTQRNSQRNSRFKMYRGKTPSFTENETAEGINYLNEVAIENRKRKITGKSPIRLNKVDDKFVEILMKKIPMDSTDADILTHLSDEEYDYITRSGGTRKRSKRI